MSTRATGVAERGIYPSIFPGALVTDEHASLYRNSPYFKNAIEHTARLFLPALIAGFALEAQKQDERAKALREALDQHMGPPSHPPVLHDLGDRVVVRHPSDC